MENYSEYRQFCDSLEVENVLELREDLVLEAIESFDFDDLLRDMLRTGSRTQRFLIKDIILEKNFSFFVSFDSIRAVLINPYQRIQYKLANCNCYKASHNNFVE
jgi:hypothetical protein